MNYAVFLLAAADAALVASILNAGDFELLLLVVLSQASILIPAIMFGFKGVASESSNPMDKRGLALSISIIAATLPIALHFWTPGQYAPWGEAPIETATAAPDLFLFAAATMLTTAALFRVLMREEM